MNSKSYANGDGKDTNDRNSSTSQSSNSYAAALEQAQRLYEQQLAILGMSGNPASYMSAYNPYSMLSAIPQYNSTGMDTLRDYQQLCAAALQQQLQASMFCNPAAALASYAAAGSGLPVPATDYMGMLTALSGMGAGTGLQTETSSQPHTTHTPSSFSMADILRSSSAHSQSPHSSHTQTPRSPNYPVVSSAGSHRTNSSHTPNKLSTVQHKPTHTIQHKPTTHGTHTILHKPTTTSKHSHAESTPKYNHRKETFPSHTGSDKELHQYKSSHVGKTDHISSQNKYRCYTEPKSQENGLDLTVKSEKPKISSITTSVIKGPADRYNKPNGVVQQKFNAYTSTGSPQSSSSETKQVSQPVACDVFSNLKRLTQQLQHENKDKSTSQPYRSPSKHVVSLLKHNNTPSNYTPDHSSKIRKAKQRANVQTKKKATSINREITPGADKTEPLQKRISSSCLHVEEETNQGPKQKRPRKSFQKPREEVETSSQSLQEKRKGTAASKIRQSHVLASRLSSPPSVNLAALEEPLNRGWKRETRIRGINRTGKLIGEVIYYSPSSKMLRSIKETLKYFTELKSGEIEIIADQNKYESDTKEQSATSTENKKVITQDLTKKSERPGTLDTGETTVINPDQIRDSSTKRQELITPSEQHSLTNTDVMSQLKPDKGKELTKDNFSFYMGVKLGDFMEQKSSGEYVKLTDDERDSKIKAASDKRDKVIERANRTKLKKQRSRDKLNKKKILESASKHKLNNKNAKLRRKELVELKKNQKALEQAERKQLQEKKKVEREQMAVFVDQMKERQRQSVLNTRLIEMKKKEGERRKVHLERLAAKERRNSRRIKELELTKELKKPNDDLLLSEIRDLPRLKRLEGLSLPGSVLADVLQIQQFITDFKDCLEIKENIPSLNTFQLYMFNLCKTSEKHVNSILCQLLQFAIRDPGINRKFVNELNQKLSTCEIDELSFSEIFRVYIDLSTQNGTQVSTALKSCPFSSLSLTDKAAGMTWLVEDLLTSQAIQNRVETNLEKISELKHERWEIEGKIREMKSSIESHKEMTENPSESPPADTSEPSISTSPSRDLMSRLDKLTRYHVKLCREVRTCQQTLRILPLGSDRYMRLYWFMPLFGGILVEGLESSLNKYQDNCCLVLETQEQAVVRMKKAESAVKPHSQPIFEEKTSPPSEVDIKMEIETKHESETKSLNDVETTSSRTATPSSPVRKFEETNTPVLYSPSLRLNDCVKQENTTPNKNMKTCKLEKITHTPDSTRETDLKSNENIQENESIASQSISSWLCSTIDDIFSGTRPSTDPNVKSPSKTKLKCNILSTESTPWFHLKRKIACKSIPHCPPDIIQNTMMFWNKQLDCEDQATIKQLTKLLTKAAPLPQPRTIPCDIQRGWWLISEYSDVLKLLTSLNTRGVREKQLLNNLNKHSGEIQRCMSGEDNTRTDDLEFAPVTRTHYICEEPEPQVFNSPSIENDCCSNDVCRTSELDVLDRIEELEQRVFQASIYTQAWADKKNTDRNDLDLVASSLTGLKEPQIRIRGLAAEKLSNLETGIERRYLLPPFGKRQEISLTEISALPSNECDDRDTSRDNDDKSEEGGNSGSESQDEETSKDGSNKELNIWRRGLLKATNISQLYISLLQLEDCIAWDKSVMRVLCQVCRSDDNEDQLLLCDGCDKGYHTYCFKPQMVNIPEGNWYCWECRSKATSVSHCIRCGDCTGKIAVCHLCPQAIHISCLQPPLQRLPRKYTCGHCAGICNSSTQSKHSRKKQSSKQDEQEIISFEQEAASESGENEDGNDDSSDDIIKCRSILDEMMKLKESEPFKYPVDTKAFPEYKKYIKKPMDLSIILAKFNNQSYETRTQFYDDMILMFDNCLLFNEDNSDVGKYGKIMRKQFMKRWKSIF